jgi:hypothetical protein
VGLKLNENQNSIFVSRAKNSTFALMRNTNHQNFIPQATGCLKICNLSLTSTFDIKPLKFSLVIPTYNEKKNIQQ